jgi:hypothetical protein
MRIKKYLLLVIVLVVFLPNTSNVVIANPIIHEPVVEVLDLIIDGSGAGGVFVNISKSFDFITQVIWSLDFDTNTLTMSNFADDTNLTNGINVYYNDVSLIDNINITANAHFGHNAYDLSIIPSENNPKERLLNARWGFDRFSPDTGGLLINTQRTLSVHIQDDLTALTSITLFQIIINGYSKTVDSYFNLLPEFFPNAINMIQLRYLTVGQNYNLHINTSNDLDYWINTTAQEETIEIYFSQEISEDTNVLNLYLYKDETFTELRTWFVEPQGYNPLGNIINTLGVAIAIFVVGFILLGLFSSKKGKR